MKRFLLLAAVMVIAVALPAQMHLYVNVAIGSDTNPGTQAQPFKTITFGLTKALNNAVLHIGPGTYSAKTGESFPIRVGSSSANAAKDVKILGLHPLATIIDMGGDGTNANWVGSPPVRNGAVHGVSINWATNVEWANIQLRNGAGTANGTGTSGGHWNQGLTVDANAKGVTVHNCIFYRTNRGAWFNGNTQNVTIYNNLALQTHNNGYGGGGKLMDNCHIIGNLVIESQAHGMWPNYAANLKRYVINNIVIKANGHGFRGTPQAGGSLFENNLTFGCKNGPWYLGAYKASPTNLGNVDPLMTNPVTDPIKINVLLKAGSPCIDAGYPKGITGAPVPIPDVINDYFGNARVVDHDENGSAIQDIGPHEMNTVALSLVQNWGQGQSPEFKVSGLGYSCFFMLGYKPTSLVISPFGVLTVDPTSFLLTTVIPVPTPPAWKPLGTLPVNAVLTGLPVYMQGLCYKGGATLPIFRPTGQLALYL